MAETPGREHKPLAPFACRFGSHVDEAALSKELNAHKLRQRKYICCGCVTALLLIQIVVLLVLIFTVFHVKDPLIKLNAVDIQGLDLSTGTLRQGVNITLTADLSVKNPNVASFIFHNFTTTIYYHGAVVGEAHGPPGQAKAKKTLWMNVTVDINSEKMLAVPELGSDLRSRRLSMMDSYTRIAGRVKILKFIKKNIVVKKNCTMAFNTTSKAVQDLNCKRRVLV